MHQELAGIQSLTLPTGAGPNDPRTVIGPSIPTELQTYYAALLGTPNPLFSVFLEYTDSGIYNYQANSALDLNGNNMVAYGWVDHGTVYETSQSIYGNGARVMTFGQNAVTQVTFGSPVRPYTDPFDNVNIFNGFIIDNRVQGRGLLCQADNPLASAAIGAEAVSLTLPSATYRTGHAFEAIHTGVVLSSVTNVGIFRVRKTDATGTILMAAPFDHRVAGSGQKINDRDVFVVTGANDVTAVLVQTTESTTGTTTWQAAGPTPRRIRIYDIGDAADYPDAPVLA